MPVHFELRPGEGLVLPRGAGVLWFGMGEREAQWAVAALADVRETWVCGAGWSFGAAYEGVELLVCGAADEGRRLDWINLAQPDAPASPVVYEGIDLFGHEQGEVERALADVDGIGLRLERSTSGYLRSVSLAARPPAPPR
ncbi:hypothetical protein OG250_11940 [Streptomyces sp. NBC_00487]|uniref:hypothetical protein n=1 Tax=unclassified Streptomyces TaxID=2593676 RepID=UPI002E182EA3|nr:MULTISPECIES: hypothetical protein [unclassified Streptomyces]